MRRLMTLVAAACLLTACTQAEDAQRGTSAGGTSATTATSTTRTSTCENGVDGYAVEHPEAWSSSSGPAGEPCRWFSPEPIAPQAVQSPAQVPIRLHVVPQPLEEVERLEGSTADVLRSDRRDVDGRPAVRQELRARGEGLLPAGTRSTQWLVELGSRTLIATTSEAATAGTYEQNAAVLDAMISSLRGTSPQPVECSGRDLPTEPEAQPGLPQAVQETRREIYLAAVRCDFDRLAELVPRDGFTYSFGGGNDPAGFWRRAELRDDGDRPMRYLAGVLQRRYGTRQVQGTTQYAWPSAFSYDTWGDVPQRDRTALEPLYDEEDFESFAQVGAYVGYRVIIAADGTWRVFVAGD